MRKAFLFVLYFLLACVAAQECAFPLTASGECSGTFSALNFEVADEDILVEVTVTQHSGEGVLFNYALGDLRLDGSAEGSFVISSPVVSEFAGESPASTRHFILSVLLCIMFLALREKRGALVLVIVLCAVAAPSVLAKSAVKIVVSVPEGSDLPFTFSPGENFILTISDEIKGKYALLPCSLVDNECYRLTSSISCVPGTFVDRTGTFAVCTGCTPVANSASPLLVTCTTATNSRVTACAPGYFLNKAGAADVCTVCLNGGATYACATGSYKTGTACTGTGNANTQTCATCTAACPAGSYTQTACSESADRVCGVCSPVTDCADAAVSCTTPDNSQCTACKTGYWRDVSGAATKCKACMNGAAAFTCPANSWKVATCTGTTTSDVQVCSPCRADCGSGFRQTAACTPSADRQCVACATNCKTCSPGPDCAECMAGFYFDAPTKTCKACTTCASNQFQSVACVSTATGASNRACVTCPANCATCTSATACTSCKAGFAGVTCTDVCAVALIPNCAAVTCNTPAVGVHRCTGGCNVGFLLTPGTPTTSDSCTTACMANCDKCSTAGSCDRCSAGFFYSTTGATGSGVCKACTLGGATPACPANSYLAKTCSHGSDNLCLACTACPAGSYASAACTSAANTVCTICTGGTACPAGFFQTTACQAGGVNTQNRVCTPCKLASSCSATQYATACTPTADLICNDCTTCVAGQYESTQCRAGGDPTVNRVCTACDVGCAAGSYQKSACTPLANRVCDTCTPCKTPTSTSDGEYETAACQAGGDVTKNRVCAACTVCTAGTAYELTACQAGGPTFDRVCAGCGSCMANEYISTACTDVAPTQCTSCADPSCTFTDPTAPAPALTGTYQTQACTATKPQVCSPCRLCDPNDKSSPDAPNGYFYETTKCRGTDTNADPGGASGWDITKNRVCTPCQSDTKNGACGDGKWRQACQAGGDPRADATCKDCGVIDCKTCTSADPATCSACIALHYRLDTLGVITCPLCKTSAACATDGTEYFDGSTCGGSTDASCKPCDSPCKTCTGAGTSSCSTCVTGYYRSGTTCIACSTGCPPGQFQTSACTDTADRICSPCAVANCASCITNKDTCNTCNTGFQLASATSCLACVPCASDQYVASGTCSPTALGDVTCAACSDTTCTPGTTPDGQYYSKICRQDGVLTQKNECSDCTDCVLGKNWEQTACQAGGVKTQNRVCQACTVCTLGTQYQTDACTTTADTKCATCADACLEGNYETSTCGPLTNRACARCTANPVGSAITCSTCPSDNCNKCIFGYYLFSTNDCRPCTVCGPEQYQKKDTPGGSYPLDTFGCESGIAIPYTAAQLGGLFYPAGNPLAPASQFDRVCVPCTKCPDGQFETSPCTPIADRVCATCGLANCDACVGANTCTTCKAGFFYVADNSVTPVQYRCQACIATCPSGFVETTPCTHDTNRVCTACTQNCLSCDGPGSACNTCAAAYYLDTDRTCTACPVGCATCLPPVAGAAPLCGSCKAGFALAAAGGKCLACPAGCATCASTATSGDFPVCIT